MTECLLNFLVIRGPVLEVLPVELGRNGLAIAMLRKPAGLKTPDGEQFSRHLQANRSGMARNTAEMGMKAEKVEERHGRSLVNDHLGALRSCIAERVFAAGMAAGNLGCPQKNVQTISSCFPMDSGK